MSGRPTRLPSPQKREIKNPSHGLDDVNKQTLQPPEAVKQTFPLPTRNISTRSAISHGKNSYSIAQGAMSEFRRGRTLARQTPLTTVEGKAEHADLVPSHPRDLQKKERSPAEAAIEVDKPIKGLLTSKDNGQAVVIQSKLQQMSVNRSPVPQTPGLQRQLTPTQPQASQTAIATRSRTNNTSTRGPPSSFKQPLGSVATRTTSQSNHKRHSSLDTSKSPADHLSHLPAGASAGSSMRLKRASSTSSKKFEEVSAAANTPASSSGKRAPTPTSSDNKRPSSSARPAFSTYQQSYSPVKRTSSKTRATATASKSGSNTASLVKSLSPSLTDATEATLAITAALPFLRIQTHVLHLSLLHQSSHSNLASYVNSARTQLESRFDALVDLYTTLLTLSRSTRQYANLLVLHRWSGGNDVSLSRKLNVLVAVLAEVCALTDLGAEVGYAVEKQEDANGELQVEHQIGRYARLVSHFEQWMTWVRTVWKVRDASTAAATETRLLKEQERNGSALYDSDSEVESEKALAERRHATYHARTADYSSAISLSGYQKVDLDGQESSFTQIEGLGDAQKAEMKSLAALLDRLSTRMQDISSPPIPDMLSSLPTVVDSDKAITTPAYLLAQTVRLVNGMREELQMMKEIEFEVVIGEKAWMEEGVRDIAVELAGR